MTIKVTLTEERSIGDHMLMHHGLSSRKVLETEAAVLADQHDVRHSEAWTSFHGEPKHTHTVLPMPDGTQQQRGVLELIGAYAQDGLSTADPAWCLRQIKRHCDRAMHDQHAAGRITFQLEPERVARLIEVLRAAGAHPSGLGSYPAANDANALADDIAAMAEGQGVK